MAERRGARGVAQRKLDGASESPPAAEEPLLPAEENPSEPPARPPISREPSEVHLRERQARWQRERAEFEAQRRRSANAPPSAG